MQHTATKSRAKRRWRFRRICADAQTLGVHRNSLYKVLAGVWKLKNLAARYAALKSDQADAAKSKTNGTKGETNEDEPKRRT
jgi:hypothetical protein